MAWRISVRRDCMRHACVRRQCGQLRPRSIQLADHTGGRIPPPPSGEHRAPHVRRGWWAGCKYRSALGDPEGPEVETRICQTVWESHLQTKQKTQKFAVRTVWSRRLRRPGRCKFKKMNTRIRNMASPRRCGAHMTVLFFFHRTGPQKTCDAEPKQKTHFQSV